MKSGKKIEAIRILKKALVSLNSYSDLSPFLVLEKAMVNVTPLIGVKKVFISGKNSSVFYFQSKKKLLFLGIKWLVTECSKNKKRFFYENLSIEIWNASNKKGFAYQKKINFYKKIIL